MPGGWVRRSTDTAKTDLLLANSTTGAGLASETCNRCAAGTHRSHDAWLQVSDTGRACPAFGCAPSTRCPPVTALPRPAPDVRVAPRNVASIAHVQAWVGHADITTIMRYRHHKSRADDARLLSAAF